MNYKMMNLFKMSAILPVLLAGSLQAKVKLPTVFSDHMVLQQQSNVGVWGWADPGKTIEVTNTWSKKSYKVKAGSAGDWKISMATPSFGGPYAITISDGEQTVLKDILIGEVWVCSGQSNMEMPLAGWGKIDNYQEEIKAANYPNIRLLQAVHVTSNIPLQDAKVTNNGWTVCNPEYVAEFSSTAYFFAREVFQKTRIPIGLIHTSWGGTIAEAWTSRNTLKNMADFAQASAAIENEAKVNDSRTDAQKIAEWQNLILKKDAGYTNGKPSWTAATVDDQSWKHMALPVLWEEAGLPDFDGIVYFRKTVTIPASWAGKPVTLNLGAIDDDDITFLDGEKIGETTGYNVPRVYQIPGDKVKAGTHVLTVRVFDGSGGGGIYGEKDVLSLKSATGEQISLAGDWAYQIGMNLKDVGPSPASNQSANRPTVLFNAMINPYLNYTIRGAIWYQGESNADRAQQYQTLFPAMIQDWRKHWNLGDFPFYFVQLANYMKPEAQPVPSAWAELRDAQLKTLSLPNTGMAVTIDIGNPADIHPKNKQEVGRRLALIALAKNYKKDIPYSGPLFSAQKVEGSVIRLSFKHTEDGLKAKDGALKGFAIAGADQHFYWATATIAGNEVVLSNPDVKTPVAVRYGWANSPGCNLYNGAGLPASPFRTDTWAGVTDGKK